MCELAQQLPEFKIVDAYLANLLYIFKSLKENAPYHLLTPSFRIEMDNVEKALNKLRVEYASQIKFQ